MPASKQPEPLSFEQIGELNKHDLENVRQFVEIVSNSHGSATPAEEFIIGLVRSHYEGGIPLTPDNVQADIDEFRLNFELSLETARRFVRLYPDLVLGDECGSWPDQFRKLKSIAKKLDDLGWKGQAESRLEIAREAIREYPSLVLSDRSFQDICNGQEGR